MKCLKDEKAHKAQHAHKYCLEGDPVTKATDCFESVFADKVIRKENAIGSANI